MKPLAYLFSLIFFFSCTSSSKTESAIIDSLETSADSTIVTETETETVSYTEQEEEGEEEETGAFDSTWIKKFARDPLGLNTYEGIIEHLKAEKIAFKDTIIEGITEVEFGTSHLSINVTEAYGDLICSAGIKDALFPLSDGIEIGMSIEDFLKTSGLPKAVTDRNTFEFLLDEGDYTWSVYFFFDEETLTGVDYSISSCVVYD